MRDLQAIFNRLVISDQEQELSPSPHLNAKLPRGSDGNAGNGAVVIGRDDCALFSAAHTRHTLKHTFNHM